LASRLEPGCRSPTLRNKDSISKKKLAAMNNSTIPAADRITHFKIVAVALAACAAILLVSMMARAPASAGGDAGIGAGGRTGKPVTASLATGSRPGA
jgi:hypothetical protein